MAAPPPVLRPSILSGAFVRVRFDDAYRLDRIGSTQLTADGRIVARLQVCSIWLRSLFCAAQAKGCRQRCWGVATRVHYNCTPTTT